MPPLRIIGISGNAMRQSLHDVVAQGRHCAVVMRRQSAQHGLARVNNDCSRSRLENVAREQGQSFEIQIVKTQHGRTGIEYRIAVPASRRQSAFSP